MSSISIRALSPRQAHALARRADSFPLLQRAMGSLWMAGCLGVSSCLRGAAFVFIERELFRKHNGVKTKCVNQVEMQFKNIINEF